ncbi:MAG: DNA-directed polymerase, beta subunit [Dehalococcoidia bacterium]|nr:DNA-directed polymerase, beta subunit [Dehalococcoidia bacterium]
MAFVTPVEQVKLPPSTQRLSYAKLADILDVPNLIEIQLRSFRWFQEEGLKDLFAEVSPIKDFSGNKLELSFADYEFRLPSPPRSEEECRQRNLTYEASLFVNARLLNKDTGEVMETPIFFGDFPLMTSKGTFITSGAERIVVSQLIRSPGVYFTVDEDPASGRHLCHAKLIPERGAWLEFETSLKNLISVKVDGKRKIPFTTLLRAIGYGSDRTLTALFEDVDNSTTHRYIESTIEKETIEREMPADEDEDLKSSALIDIYKRLRPGDPPNLESAHSLISNLFFHSRRYDLGKVGRHKLNQRLRLDPPSDKGILTNKDLVEIARRIIMVNNGQDGPDDIDHLGNRRIRTVGELLQSQFRVGLVRLERLVKERMSIIGPEAATPANLINVRPLIAAVREFFGGSQLSQFMDQTNPLAELTHKRRLSAMGPGGLSREHAGFDVRDVHHSHYGRICPIETPEGPNIGLIGSLATYGVVNEFGFIETPYRKVTREMTELSNRSAQIQGRKAAETVADENGEPIVKTGQIIRAEAVHKLALLSPRLVRVVPLAAELEGRRAADTVKVKEETVVDSGDVITAEAAQRLAHLSKMVKVSPFASEEIVYLTADKEEENTIAQATARVDAMGQFVEDKVEARRGNKYLKESPAKIDFMDVSPKQIVSVATSLIPFLEHNDANRALMGSNMQRQAVPLLRPEAPLVATGMEKEVARYSGQVTYSSTDGEVTSVTSTEIKVKDKSGQKQSYPIMKFRRTNQGTCVNQRPVVSKGDRVAAGQVLADSSATEMGELALGQNVLCAFMSWEGYNFEDAIIISEKLIREDKFTSVHIEKYEVEARDTKLGPEEITRDIPNVGEESLRELDERGIVRLGAEVAPGDILVGRITPKGETELTAEEKLLRAIFGEKAREVKDNSLRVPHGEWGKVIEIKCFNKDHDRLSPGVNEFIQVWVAQKRKLSVGDKMAGRHGNKGVISRILPEEDMPFLPDGRPIDIILNPIGVPSRMNLGQVMETHLGWAADALGFKALSPVFDGCDDIAIEDALARAWIAQQAKATFFDPSDGRGIVRFDQEKAKAWLQEHGIDGEQVFSSTTPGEASDICLRLWLETRGHSGIRGLGRQELKALVDKEFKEKRAVAPIMGKMALQDGRTGDSFDQPVTVGNLYILKLIHLVEDKVHARSTGPYSLITQQPLGGKAQFGGQRFGEMEVWSCSPSSPMM